MVSIKKTPLFVHITVFDPSTQPTTTPKELQHKQTFDQSAAISALASLANSGNLDSGGGQTPRHGGREMGAAKGCLDLDQ